MGYYMVKVALKDIEDLPNGKTREKKWSEYYLCEAVSVTDAEVIMTEEFKGSVIEFEIKSVSESGIVGFVKKK